MLLDKDIKGINQETIDGINKHYEEIKEKYTDVNERVIKKLFVFDIFGVVTWGNRSFVEAIATNNLMRAYARADLENREMIPRYADFLNYEMHTEAVENTEKWKESNGALGKEISVYKVL